MKINLLSVRRCSKIEGEVSIILAFHIFSKLNSCSFCVIIFLHLLLIEHASVLYCFKARKQIDSNYFFSLKLSK